MEELIESFEGPFETILVFGPPGSGKGTQSKFIAHVGNHFHLSSGDVFRGLSPDSPAGKLFYKYSSKGELVPDDVTIEIWHHFMNGLIETNRYHPKEQLLLLDGIPRTLNQAKIMDKYIHVKKIIVLEAPDMQVFVQRILRRALIEKRADDKDENVLKNRMQVYEKNTQELLSHYPEEVVSRFNANQRPIEVLRDVLNSLSDIL